MSLVDNSFELVPMIVVFIIIAAWCFYLRFIITFLQRRKLMWVEVQDYHNNEYSISRNKAK